MRTITQSQIQAYNNISIRDKFNAIRDERIFNNLRLVQKCEIKDLEKKYSTTRMLTNTEKYYLDTIYINFVINKYSFNKPIGPGIIGSPKEAESVAVKLAKQHNHIGMRMLHNLTY